MARAEAGEGLDLSLIAQLLGDKEAGLAHPARGAVVPSVVPLALCFEDIRGCAFWRWRRRPTWAATRRSSSCSRNSGIELMMLYVIGGGRIAGAAARS